MRDMLKVNLPDVVLVEGKPMRRREFVAVLGAAIAVWPFSIGARLAASFLQGLKEESYVESQNVVIEYNWAEGQYDRLVKMADELVRRLVAVLVTSGGTVAARAAKSATKGIPIVFSTADDPVAAGLVTSLNRPGNNYRRIFERRNTPDEHKHRRTPFTASPLTHKLTLSENLSEAAFCTARQFNLPWTARPRR